LAQTLENPQPHVMWNPCQMHYEVAGLIGLQVAVQDVLFGDPDVRLMLGKRLENVTDGRLLEAISDAILTKAF
jgi:hypothetical protein